MQTLTLQGKRTFTLYYKRYDSNFILLLAITRKPVSVCFEIRVNPQTDQIFISQLFYQAYPLSYQLLKETVSNNQKLFHQFIWTIKKSISFDYGV
jgi:hypothetical protein